MDNELSWISEIKLWPKRVIAESSTRLIIFLSLAFLFIIPNPNYMYALELYNPSMYLASNKSGQQEKKGAAFTFTVGAKIIKGKCLKIKDKTWIDGALFCNLMKSLGVESSYDPSTSILALGNAPINTGKIKLTKHTGDPFKIVINGKIFKTGQTRSGNSVYIPIDTIKTILEAMGNRVEVDNSSNLAAVSSGGSSAKTGISPSKSPIPDKTPHTGTPSPVPAGIQAEAVGNYMNALKKVMDKHRPGKKEKEKFGTAIPGPANKETPTSDDMKGIQKKLTGMLEDIRRLSPPNEETKEIHRMALSVTTKMIRIMDLASGIHKLPKDRANPKVEQELLMLVRQVRREEPEFREKVRILRKKYNLGPP